MALESVLAGVKLDDARSGRTTTKLLERYTPKRCRSCPGRITLSREPLSGEPSRVATREVHDSRYLNTAFGVARIKFSVAPRPTPPEPSIFENECFRVSRTPTTGWGCFAKRALLPGEHVLIERPLFEANFSTLYIEFDKLDKREKQVVMSLHAHSPSDYRCKIASVFRTNCFATRGRFSGLFPIASRFNHACKPPKCNVRYVYDVRHAVLVLTISAVVREGDELRLCYGKCPLNLFLWYGFRCDCGGCDGVSDEEVKAFCSPW